MLYQSTGGSHAPQEGVVLSQCTGGSCTLLWSTVQNWVTQSILDIFLLSSNLQERIVLSQSRKKSHFLLVYRRESCSGSQMEVTLSQCTGGSCTLICSTVWNRVIQVYSRHLHSPLVYRRESCFYSLQEKVTLFQSTGKSHAFLVYRRKLSFPRLKRVVYRGESCSPSLQDGVTLSYSKVLGRALFIIMKGHNCQRGGT